MAAPVTSPSYTDIVPGAADSTQPQAPEPTQIHDESESEYEYEYDEEETEDFYFTLDLTTHVPDAIIPKEYAKNGKRMRRTAEERREASEKAGHPLASMRGDADVDNDREFGALQFVGLDTKEPYVKFNNEFFTCSWFTDVGTQLWISHPGVVENPRMAGHVLDVIGSSQARLVGKPATLRMKHPAAGVENAQTNHVNRTITISEDEESEDESLPAYMPAPAPVLNPDQPLIVPRHRIKDSHSKGQADFMERLSALRIKRGETDAHAIPLRMPILYKGASNPSELRKAALAIDATKMPKPARGSSILRKPSLAAKDLASRVDPSLRESTAGGENEDDANGSMTPAMRDSSKHGMRTKDGPKGGAPKKSAIRAGLGLEPGSRAPPKRKVGRPTRAEVIARTTSEVVGMPREEDQSPAASTEARLGTAFLATTPDAASVNKADEPSASVDIEGDDVDHNAEPGTFYSDGLTYGSDPEGSVQGASSNMSQPRASATPSIAGTPYSMSNLRTPSVPAATTPGLSNASRRNSHTSQTSTPAPNASGSAPKPKRPRRTDAEMHAAQVEEARLRGEPTPPPRKRKPRRTPAQMAQARRNQERVEAEQAAAVAATPQDDEDGTPAASTPGAEGIQAASTEGTPAPKQRKKRRTAAEMAAAREAAPPKKKRRTAAQKKADEEAQAAREEEARRLFMTPGAMPVEMELSFDGAGNAREGGGDVEERSEGGRADGGAAVLDPALKEAGAEEQAGDEEQT